LVKRVIYFGSLGVGLIKARAQGEEEFDWISRWVPAPGACVARRRGVFCTEEESTQLHTAAAMGRRLWTSLGRDHRSVASGGQGGVVWSAKLDWSELQR